ncbi:shikimate kinase [Nicoliella lavandulae]|uniref:Shikimate kinase n=1 Tax=Nicoliella lavandulae TaxID=3082954 RepID=A0ABU8SPD7_9LACO
MNITLIGFMGSGKTTVANALSQQLEIEQNDLDEMVLQRTGLTIPEYFEQYGEAKFRKLEMDNLQLALATGGILSTGGGTPMQANNFKLIQEANTATVFLNAQDNTITHHLIHDGIEERPLFKQLGIDGIIKLKHERQLTYEQLADVIIDVDHKSPELIVNELMEKLSEVNSND